MRSSVISSSFLSAAALLVLAAAPAAAQSVPPAGPMPPGHPPISTIQTSATGEVKAAPDRATIQFTVETRDSTAAAASAANATKQQAVLAALRAAGLAEADVGTISYTIVPDMQYDQETRQSRVVGYVARNTVQAVVRDVSRVGTVIDRAVSAGANGVEGLQFETSRSAELRRQALGSAMATACRDADALARAAGGTLGGLLSASSGDVGAYPPPRPMMMAKMESAAAAPTPVVPGELTLTVSVATSWFFVPAGAPVPAGASGCH